MIASTPRVSIVCPFLDAERFLAEAVDSVLEQDFRDWELLLVDDGSRDASGTIAREYAARDPARVRVLSHPNGINRGASLSRNLALEQARGELIAFIDADDVWRPGKLAQQIALIDRLPDAGMVCGKVNYWSSWTGGDDFLVQTGLAERLIVPPDTLLTLYPLGTAPAPCPSDIVVRRAVVERIGAFAEGFEGPWQVYEDQTFFTKAYLDSPVWFSSQVWLDYRQHDASCTAVSHRKGHYPEMRRAFLGWLAGYARAQPDDSRAAIFRAITSAEWELDHPLAARVSRRLRAPFG